VGEREREREAVVECVFDCCVYMYGGVKFKLICRGLYHVLIFKERIHSQENSTSEDGPPRNITIG